MKSVLEPHPQSQSGGLGPGQGLLSSPLRSMGEGKSLKAPFIITCVGSITTATLRLANATAGNTNEALGRPVLASEGPGLPRAAAVASYRKLVAGR